MRLAFVFLTYGRNVFGGIENALYNLTCGLKDIGHNLFVFTSGAYATRSDKQLPAKLYVSDHLPTKYGGKVTNLIRFLENNSKNINSDFDRFLKACLPDYVIVIDPIWGILPVTGYKFGHKVPFAISYHIANKWPETKKIMKRSFTLPFIRRLSVSEFLSGEISTEFPESKNVTFDILPNSVDTDKYRCQRSTSENYIFCNSRIAFGKNVDILVKAFREISGRKDLKLKICSGSFPFGDENEEIEQIKRFISGCGVEESVELLPALNWDAVPKMVTDATLVALPSTYETFGLAALEAAVAGTPLVVADAANFKNLVRSSALFFEPNNPKDLARKILVVLDNLDSYKKSALEHSALFRSAYDNKVVAERLVSKLITDNTK